MDITQVPFAEHNGIVIDDDGRLSLPFKRQVQNHFEGVHAGAQFLLAESASGYYLLTHFPDLVGKVSPLLRESTITFYKQSQSDLSSTVNVTEEVVDKFLKTLSARGRAVIELSVDVMDSEQQLTCSGKFRWFVQTI